MDFRGKGTACDFLVMRSAAGRKPAALRGDVNPRVRVSRAFRNIGSRDTTPAHDGAEFVKDGRGVP